MKSACNDAPVLILVVVDNGLVQISQEAIRNLFVGLNPCCSGQWSRTTEYLLADGSKAVSLNPCCSGQWSRTRH